MCAWFQGVAFIVIFRLYKRDMRGNKRLHSSYLSVVIVCKWNCFTPLLHHCSGCLGRQEVRDVTRRGTGSGELGVELENRKQGKRQIRGPLRCCPTIPLFLSLIFDFQPPLANHTADGLSAGQSLWGLFFHRWEHSVMVSGWTKWHGLVRLLMRGMRNFAHGNAQHLCHT